MGALRLVRHPEDREKSRDDSNSVVHCTDAW
jgi:hypothetical protein